MFGRLGRFLVRHPWYPIAFWVALLVVTVPFLPLLGSVTTNSTTSLPTNSPSARASAELGALFPNQTGGDSSILLFYGPNLTDENGQSVVLNVTAALADDRSLADVASIANVYTEYAGYLAGQAQLAGGVLRASVTGPEAVPPAVNASASLLWGPPALFLADWQALVSQYPSPGDANYPAFLAANASLSNATARIVLATFYPAFNRSFSTCVTTPALVTPCADAAARQSEGPLVATLFPPAAAAVATATLAGLGAENFTAWRSVQEVTVGVVGPEAGLPSPFLLTVWTAFPSAVVPPDASAAWANASVAATTLARELLPVPAAISSRFVNAAGTASIVTVSFSVGDDTTNASGAQPVYDDLNRIDALVPGVVRAHDATLTIRYLQTGNAPLDLLTNTSVNASIMLVLPLTVGLLLVISMAYFRSPVTPLVTFAALGIALLLGLGGTILVGTLVGHVDTTSITLEEVFVLGVGTDYSIFLTARYREELLQGKSSDDAVVGAVTWAGQSVATSGSTAIMAMIALAFSGVALLGQWGEVLSLAVLATVLLSLTMVPALLKLFGPRIFWPMTGDRFSRQAVRVGARLKAQSTYFYRAGKASARRPKTILLAVALISVPLVAVALTAPLSYDFYAQLPSGHPAAEGLDELGSHFGAGFAVPSFALVTFASPLVVGNTTNATEFNDLAALTARANATTGIATVRSPVGPYGAPLADWLALSTLPSATRTNLLGVLSGYVGTDGRTVLLDLVPSDTGLSVGAVGAIDSVTSSFQSYTATHPEVTNVAYGGGAPTISDLADQTKTATNYLIVAVTVGLIIVLLAVLRSWILAVMAVATIGLSITWAWAVTYLVFDQVLGFPLFFYVQTLLIMLVLGLGIDYNIFLLTRVREERLRGRSSGDAAVEAVARTGGIITAAALILACAFGALLVGSFTLIRAIGFSVAVAVILDAMVVRTYLVPATLRLLGDRAWSRLGIGRRPTASVPGGTPPAGDEPAVPP